MSIAEQPRLAPLAWYEQEVPSIIAGLQATGTLSDITAGDAWRLIEAGSYDEALTIALDEVL